MAKNLPGDLVAEWEALRPPEPPDPFMSAVIDAANNNLKAAGGWCAPAKVEYSIEMDTLRG